jgi:hypothetical protein
VGRREEGEGEEREKGEKREINTKKKLTSSFKNSTFKKKSKQQAATPALSGRTPARRSASRTTSS